MMGSNGLPPGAELPGKYQLSDIEPDIALRRDGVPYVLFENVQNYYPTFRDAPMNYIRGWLTIPLRVRGKLIGFISLDSRTSGKFTDHDAELALTFANQVSIAIENARLFSDLQAELASRKSLIAELESKNAELERFTYTVSHDLKSPLFTIRGFLGYLEQDALASNHDRVKADMQRIIDATNRMQQLLNELLELSRIGRVKNEPVVVPFADLAHEAVDLSQGRIMGGHITVQIDEDMPNVYGDRQRLLEAVQNLVDNSAKFSSGQNAPRIEIGYDGREEDMYVFHVSDNGIGIPPEHHERIFGLFNKLDVKTDGTGIGLAIVKRIIDTHGGRIWVRSDAGKGAVFFFTLPSEPSQDKSSGE
jgi:signal transduction histidine kinase